MSDILAFHPKILFRYQLLCHHAHENVPFACMNPVLMKLSQACHMKSSHVPLWAHNCHRFATADLDSLVDNLLDNLVENLCSSGLRPLEQMFSTCGPPVVRGYLHGGPRAKPVIYFYLN